MDIEKALTVIEALAAGHDPVSGEVLGSDHLCQKSDVIRALLQARNLVEREARRERALKRARLSLPSNTGKSWTSDEDSVLVQRFRTGASITDMATLHARTHGSIQARLEKLGQIKPTAPKAMQHHPQRAFDA